MHADQVGRDETADQWVRAVVAVIGDRPAVEQWVERLPPGYRERTPPADAAADLRIAAAIAGATDGDAAAGGSARFGAVHRLRLGDAPTGDPADVRLRRVGPTAVELTAVLPVLESFGLAVTEAMPFVVGAPGPSDGSDIHVDDFGLRIVGAGRIDVTVDGARLVEALEAAGSGTTDVDGLNRLVIASGLDWRQVVVLRAYRRYRRQCSAAATDEETDDTLVAFPEVAAALVRYFEARFGDAAVRNAGLAAARAADADASSADADADAADSSSADADSRAPASAAARQEVIERLGAVPHLQQDQILRAFLALIDATLRTNWYRRGSDGRRRSTLALKLDSSRAPGLPAPRPHVETFVHGPDVEGVHLRNGAIARGGIRWSERPSDFRTEVLGLAAAQTKKNAIIVPTGAKGGFVVRGTSDPGGAGGAPPVPGSVSPVLGAYRQFISALLDITDSVVDGRVVHPAGVVAPDGDDPYLVVAADRGTATFSDEANALSATYDFWLGDAFASGGTHGYDHKAMGITARGAWVAVRRHFRQLGIDVQREAIRVAGVGDMSGDVFGNGMLQSRALQLVAAFDHRHIFVDPNPDPERSYAARAALAARPRSSWADYDKDALSPGGGIWSRDSKQVELAPEAWGALGLRDGVLRDGVLRPPELVSAILTAPLDLLWFGGIGTFVKATDEADTAVGDHANDAVRVTADRVRARVIAEGGNLGVTQRGRIRYSRRGGRINTDFIDNAAGVATSDREVNLKILLGLAAEQGRLGPGERDQLLAAATDEVAREVLRQVDHSVAALDRSLPDSARALDAYVALLEHLEAAGLVDRAVESLPDDDELAGRRAAGAGLIRPELAVLLAFAKSDLFRAIDASDLAEDPALLDAVEPYFPSAITAQASDLIRHHRLYPQLVATDLAGEVVDELGVVWAHETAAELGRPLAEVAGAVWAARQVTGAGALWSRLEADAPGLDADAEAAVHAAVVAAVTLLSRSYLRRPGTVTPGALIAADQALADSSVAASDATAHELRALGVDAGLAGDVAVAGRRATVGALGPVVRATGRPFADVTDAVAAFEQLAVVAALRERIAAVIPSGRWAAWQARALGDDLDDLQRAAVTAALAPADPAPHARESPADAVRRWADRHSRSLARAGALVQAAEPDADPLVVVPLAIRILVAG